MRSIVAYLRVSTQGQSKSGLGIEAQRAAVARFAETEGFQIAGEHVEVETGKGAAESRLTSARRRLISQGRRIRPNDL